jgi:hypothetical protein
MKSPGWPALKVLFNFLRVFMPAEFIVVAVAFFDTKWSQDTCQKFYLFEPICTAILLACTSAIHVIRVHAIYDRSKQVLALMTTLFAIQIVTTGVASGFFRSVPLKEGQGCIAGPKHTWVGVYWVAVTLFYTVSFALAVNRSLKSLSAKPLSPWKLMLRDGLNLYGAIFLVNLTNMIFFFVIRPTGVDDPVRTIVTSMAAVLTTSMSLRIVLSVRGNLAHGGSFALSNSTNTGSSRTTNVITTRTGGGVPTHISTHGGGHTFTLDEMRSKPEGEWNGDNKSSVNDTESKARELEADAARADVGVKITINREIDYDESPYPHAK